MAETNPALVTPMEVLYRPSRHAAGAFIGASLLYSVEDPCVFITAMDAHEEFPAQTFTLPREVVFKGLSYMYSGRGVAAWPEALLRNDYVGVKPSHDISEQISFPKGSIEAFLRQTYRIVPANEEHDVIVARAVTNFDDELAKLLG